MGPLDHPNAAMADVVVDDPGHVLDAVAANPIASVALALHLRASAALDVPAALVAESATYSLLQSGPEHQGWLAAQPARTTHADDRDPVRVERVADVLRITLDRPDVRNAYSAAMRDALCEALAVAHHDPALVVELRGAGANFSSGGDLAEFGTLPDPATAHVIRVARSAGRALDAVRDRATVHVHGACVGAGVELGAFAGRVVAAPDATFRLPEVAMGLVPGAGGTVSIPRRIGRHRAGWLALTGSAIDAPTALDWGLVDEIRGDG